jgi:uracil-DNA glycosylase
MHFNLEPSWKKVLQEELKKPYMAELSSFLDAEYARDIPVYPPKELIFNAFWKTPFEKVNVVVVGQDPYHGPGQAHGLSFSVPKGVRLPPSLKNIFKELVNDTHIPFPSHGCLESWAGQGVLLLNVTLTVSEGKPLSHHNQGWELFTDAVLKALATRENPPIFILWGNSAIKKCLNLNVITLYPSIKVLSSSHPSPFSARKGFFGCKHFSTINDLLVEDGKIMIDWGIF